MFPWNLYVGAKPKHWDKLENDFVFQNVLMNLINLTMDEFEFEGLPETCNERFFKMALIVSGMAMIAKDEDIGYVSLSCAPAGSELNIYGEYPKVFGYGWNGFNKEYTAYMYGTDTTDVEAVVCYDNYTCYPMINYLIQYAKSITETIRTIDETASKLKTPYFIVCDEVQKVSVKKILEDIDFNKNSIITNKATSPDMFKILPTNVREGALSTLWNHYNNLQTNIRSLIGIQGCVNQDKKERLLVDEVNSDMDIAQLNINYRLKNYKIFCDTVNKVFGLNISVKGREVGNNGSTSDTDRTGTESEPNPEQE